MFLDNNPKGQGEARARLEILRAAIGDARNVLTLTRHDVHAELGQIVAGVKPGRTSDAQLTVADLTGVGFQDTAIASAALDRIPIS